MADEADTREDDSELPPGPFVKIYGSIVYSSIWQEDSWTRLLWITMLAIADQNGDIRASVRGLAYTAKLPPEECEKALAVLEAPDPDSRDPQFEGRRIQRMKGGWHILNFRRYREMRTPEQVNAAERQRRHRAKPGTQPPREREQGPPLPPVTGVTVTPEVEGEVESDVVVEGTAEPTSPHPPPPPADTDDAQRLYHRGLYYTTALNKGLHANPAIGELYNPVIGTAPAAAMAAAEIESAGVEPTFAWATYYALAKNYNPQRRGDQIRSLSYLTAAVITAWEREKARQAAADAPTPAPASAAAGKIERPANGRRDLKGEGLIIFGRLRDAVRETIILNDPNDPGAGNYRTRIIDPEELGRLNAQALTALMACGGAVQIARSQDETLSWKFAAAYAAAHTIDPRGAP